MTEYWTEETGFAEALRRIRAFGEAHSDTLDLGGLSLTRLPGELTWLRHLYLGGDPEVRQEPWLAYQPGGSRHRCNALRMLPGTTFRALTRLETLDLAHNPIGADGARALAGLTALTSLYLRNCGIGADGACALTALTRSPVSTSEATGSSRATASAPTVHARLLPSPHSPVSALATTASVPTAPAR